MIWVQHDFYENFTQGATSNDIDLSLDIFRSELSDLLTYKSEALFSLFDKLSIKHKKNASYEELLDIVLREMKVNDKFIRGLAFLIGESNDVVQNNKSVSWEKLLNGITKQIKIIKQHFIDFPKKEYLFRKKVLEMTGLKSSVTGDDARILKKKDYTVLWVLGVIAVGVAGYFVWRHYDKIKQDKMRAESLLPKLETGGTVLSNNDIVSTPVSVENAVAPTAQVAPVLPATAVTPTVTPAPSPQSLDPAYNVSKDVLLPVAPAPVNPSPVQINVQPMAQATPMNNVANVAPIM